MSFRSNGSNSTDQNSRLDQVLASGLQQASIDVSRASQLSNPNLKPLGIIKKKDSKNTTLKDIVQRIQAVKPSNVTLQEEAAILTEVDTMMDSFVPSVLSLEGEALVLAVGVTKYFQTYELVDDEQARGFFDAATVFLLYLDATRVDPDSIGVALDESKIRIAKRKILYTQDEESRNLFAEYAGSLVDFTNEIGQLDFSAAGETIKLLAPVIYNLLYNFAKANSVGNDILNRLDTIYNVKTWADQWSTQQVDRVANVKSTIATMSKLQKLGNVANKMSSSGYWLGGGVKDTVSNYFSSIPPPDSGSIQGFFSVENFLTILWNLQTSGGVLVGPIGKIVTALGWVIVNTVGKVTSYRFAQVSLHLKSNSVQEANIYARELKMATILKQKENVERATNDARRAGQSGEEIRQLKIQAQTEEKNRRLRRLERVQAARKNWVTTHKELKNQYNKYKPDASSTTMSNLLRVVGKIPGLTPFTLIKPALDAGMQLRNYNTKLIEKIKALDMAIIQMVDLEKGKQIGFDRGGFEYDAQVMQDARNEIEALYWEKRGIVNPVREADRKAVLEARKRAQEARREARRRAVEARRAARGGGRGGAQVRNDGGGGMLIQEIDSDDEEEEDDEEALLGVLWPVGEEDDENDDEE
jgi:hypothetical protein